MINKLSRLFYDSDLGILLIRIVTGVIFIEHGVSKLTYYHSFTDLWFHVLGLPLWVAGFVAYVEVIGGAMLILGILTRVAGVLLGIDMLAAVFLTGITKGLAPHDLELSLMAASFGIALMGSGRLSLFKMECNYCGGMLCKGKEGCPART